MITILDYKAGNLFSLTNALNKLGKSWKIANNPSDILNAEKIIVPGVGQANQAMKELKKLSFDKALKETKAKFLGICLGMQLLGKFSEEGNTKCLGLIPTTVKLLQLKDLKVPHIGWNQVEFAKNNQLFKNISNKTYFYFVHSYFMLLGAWSIAETLHGLKFCSALKANNFYGVQFHPEKSGETGLTLLKNFCDVK